jgi:hypothetical protein
MEDKNIESQPVSVWEVLSREEDEGFAEFRSIDFTPRLPPHENSECGLD